MQRRKGVGARALQSAGVGLGAGLFALVLWLPGGLDIWEAATWDWRVNVMAAPGKATDDIRLIVVDQNSLDWGASVNGWPWPWPRQIFGAVVDFCRRAGAKALGFDVLFLEFSRYGVEDDEFFGRSIGEYGKFAAAAFLGNETGSETRWPEGVDPPDFSINGLEEWMGGGRGEGVRFDRASFPVPEVFQSAAMICNVHQNPDADGVYRRVRLFGVFDETALPSLALGVYLAGNPGETARIIPGRMTVGERTVPISKEGNAVLRYRGPARTHKAYSAAQVLQVEARIMAGEDLTARDRAMMADIEGKYILFGYVAPGLHDLRPSPTGSSYSGVEINATLLDNLLSGDFMKTTPKWAAILLVFAFSMTTAGLSTFFGKPGQIVGIGAAAAAVPVLLALGAYAKGFWLPIAVCEVSVAATIVLTLIYYYSTEGRQKRYIKNAFQQYLSPSFIEQLIQDPEKLKLGGERRELSIFFSDLQGFTSISMNLTPETLTALLNDYLSAMTDIVIAEAGTVDKYEGDAIIAFWNAPLDVTDHAVRSVRAALRCQRKLAELRPGFYDRIGRQMLMRIGLNTGPAVVGNFGSNTKFDYTMLGDAVNLAARLEGVNKQFGTYTMISQSTRDQMGDAFAVRELGRVVVVGRNEPAVIYEPMFHEEFEDRKDVLTAFHEGLKWFYEGRFAEAEGVFARIASQDPPAAAYKTKCMKMMDEVPEDWKGIWVMDTK